MSVLKRFWRDRNNYIIFLIFLYNNKKVYDMNEKIAQFGIIIFQSPFNPLDAIKIHPVLYNISLLLFGNGFVFRCINHHWLYNIFEVKRQNGTGFPFISRWEVYFLFLSVCMSFRRVVWSCHLLLNQKYYWKRYTIVWYFSNHFSLVISIKKKKKLIQL